MENETTQMFGNLITLFNAITEYRSTIFSISVNSYDFKMLKSNPNFEILFEIKRNVNGEDFINGILLHLSPLVPNGTFYLHQKLFK